MDSKPSNPKDAAATDRLDLSLFPATARAYGALALQEGDFKYGGYNYRAAGIKASVYYAAINRHLDKWFNGQDSDPKTKIHHLANAIAGLAVLIDGMEVNNWTDDRPPVADLDGLLGRCEPQVAHLRDVFGRRAERYTAARPMLRDTTFKVHRGGHLVVFTKDQRSGKDRRESLRGDSRYPDRVRRKDWTVVYGRRATDPKHDA